MHADGGLDDEGRPGLLAGRGNAVTPMRPSVLGSVVGRHVSVAVAYAHYVFYSAVNHNNDA